MVSRCAESVRAAFGHGVDGGSHEVAVFHVECGVHYLYVFQSLECKRSAGSRHLLAVETHVGVEVGSVDAIVVHTAVASAERTATGIVGRHGENVLYGTVDGGTVVYVFCREVFRRACLSYGSCLTCDYHFPQFVACGEFYVAGV